MTTMTMTTVIIKVYIRYIHISIYNQIYNVLCIS